MDAPDVPFLDLSRIYEVHQHEINRVWERVAKRGWYVMGKEGSEFEGRFAALLDTKWCAGVANGTDAIELGLRAMGVGAGDEVITTPLTAMPTLLAIAATGASIKLADVDEKSAQLDVDLLESVITSKTKCIVPVHLYGQMGEMDRLTELAKKKGIRVLEDCAQAHLATYKGKKAGLWGDLASWSFYPTKNLGAFGDAGAVTSRHPEFESQIRSLRNYGQRATYDHAAFGRNSRLDELQAGLLTCRMAHLQTETERRREIARRYREALHGKIQIISGCDDSKETESCYHLFVVVVSGDRNLFKNRLSEKGVGSLVHYPIPGHLQGAFSHLGYGKGDFKKSEFLANQVLSLPLHAFLSDREVEKVIHAVSSVL